jgi:DNA-binding XRE family transcriptional regulator
MTQIRLRTGTLHRLCQKYDCSRDELARRIRVSTTTAYRIDSGQVMPSPKFIGALMLVSGEAFEDLFEVVENVA